MIGGALAGLYLSVNALTAARRTFSKTRHASSCRPSCVFDVLVLLSLFCLSVCFSSCSSGKKRYVIGVSQCSEDIWRNKLNNELRDAVYVHENVELSIKSADDEDEKQAEQINRFVDDGVDILIVAPNQVNSVTKPIAKAYGKGIPVIFFDRRAGDSKYTAFIGGDNVKIGRTIGEYIASKLGGKGTVAEIMGLEGSSPAIERHKGFIEALSKYPGIRLVASQSGTWQQESGRRIAEGVFAAGVRPDYVFAHNDRMAFGAWQVARRLGLGDKIKFVGIDALPGKDGGIRLVRDGVLDASYIYPTRGDLVIQLALNILEGRPYKKDNYMKAALVTKDNAETMLMQAEEISHMSSQLEELHGKLDFFFTQYSHQKIYFMLSIVILVLVLVVFVISYRMAMVKRRMEREAADAKLAFFTDISHVPVILLTSQAFAEQRAEGYDCGADAYITKPFSSKVLVSRVRNLLENRKRLKYVYGVVADNVQKECGDVDSRFMDDFRRVVEEYLADSNLTVETVSAALNLSRVQMYRKVKQLTGSSPVELIRVTRLKRAEHLLKTTNMTVSEISYEVGFSSPSYFSKCFKDHFGTAPGDMR
mgnify:CR=1 FL=1